MFLKKKSKKHETYQICIAILEAKHLIQNENPLVVVKVGNQKRKTAVREKTDNPHFNDYFVFDITSDLNILLSTRIMISVYLRNFLRQTKFYGGIEFEVAIVWDQPDHQYYHKWAMLTNPKDPKTTPKGYVKCNIAVHSRGERVKIHPETDGEDDIEGNLLLPLGESIASRQRARYILVIYRADGLPIVRASSCCGSNNFSNINPYVQISFAGMKASTREQKHTYEPRFNEKIIFREMFPPLSHRIRITIKDRVFNGKNVVVATHILNLRTISNSKEDGFLPTFGPSFINFYRDDKTSKCRYPSISYCSPVLPIYTGRVLVSLKTEIVDPETFSSPGVEVEPSAAIIENMLWKSEEYLLVGVFYDICMIDRSRFKNKPITFEISLGNAGNQQFYQNQTFQMDEDCRNENNNDCYENRVTSNSQTSGRLTGTHDEKFNYMPLGSNKPCVYVKSWWPNVEWRISNTNHLTFIANFLSKQLEKLEELISMEDENVYKSYNDVMESLKQYCVNYLHMLNTGRCDDEGGSTKLDRLRLNLCRQAIEDILRMIKVDGTLSNNNYIKIAMAHAYKYLKKIQDISEDPQHGLPDAFIWMIAGTKRVAYARLPARSIIYSEDELARGEKCGQRINVFMKNAENQSESFDYSACKVEVFLWLANAKFAAACWSAIPPGYDVDHEPSSTVFPRFIEYVQSSTFQLRAHIFQGRFDAGMDASGLLDPFVRIIFHGYTLVTKVIKQSLNPFWDQTLVFTPIVLHGTRENIKLAPPKVALEAFDKDICGTMEFCGRAVATPVVKLNTEPYSMPNYPPKLSWYKLTSHMDSYDSSVLAAFELIEVGDEEIIDLPLDPDEDKMYKVPDDIRPKMTRYRLEVLFWGVRDMKKINFTPVHRPKVVVECGGVLISSETIENARKNCNFDDNHVMIDLDLPEESSYYPSITIKAYDSRGFGCFKYSGVCIVPSAQMFFQQLISREDHKSQMFGSDATLSQHSSMLLSRQQSHAFDFGLYKEEETLSLISQKKPGGTESLSRMSSVTNIIKKGWSNLFNKSREDHWSLLQLNDDELDDETLDWWCRYYASLEAEKNKNNKQSEAETMPEKKIAIFTIYQTELEMQPQFSAFEDRLKSFDLLKGKRSGDPYYDQNNYVGRFKGYIALYNWPKDNNIEQYRSKSGKNVADGLCSDYPSPEPVHLLIRLYVIKGIALRPSDPLSGKSDPYMRIRLGKNLINDRKNYIPNELNPTFGKLFEIEATLPQDYLLKIQVWDYDATSADDFIGETIIDIENRFYSRHRAHCGIAKSYHSSGYNTWRDPEKPTQILALLCQRNSLPQPEYLADCVKIGRRKFDFVARKHQDPTEVKEDMALNVLWHWDEFHISGCPLVPEHVERRPLFNPARPGLEQGKLEMWVDAFRINELPLRPPVNITPQPAEDYEIRVTIWNTEAVPLVDNQFLTGEKCSDIYVKGWIVYDDLQKTDVHYNSLNGEGNFNWRFVFRVTYFKAEQVMIVKKKASLIAKDETEERFPCKLHLQVWDSDHFSPDDFLGALTLNLSRMPKGSTNSNNCTLKIMDPSSPTINLFKLTRTRGWWPFTRILDAKRFIQAGKVEMEISIVPIAEAKDNPVGKARNPPEPLPPPNRPDTSFSWFRNPWKACCFVVCRHYKWRILCCLFSVLLVLLVACGIYAFPGYLVKRLLGA